jgi:hypothetical protein
VYHILEENQVSVQEMNWVYTMQLTLALTAQFGRSQIFAVRRPFEHLSKPIQLCTAGSNTSAGPVVSPSVS